MATISLRSYTISKSLLNSLGETNTGKMCLEDFARFAVDCSRHPLNTAASCEAPIKVLEKRSCHVGQGSHTECLLELK